MQWRLPFESFVWRRERFSLSLPFDSNEGEGENTERECTERECAVSEEYCEGKNGDKLGQEMMERKGGNEKEKNLKNRPKKVSSSTHSSFIFSANTIFCCFFHVRRRKKEGKREEEGKEDKMGRFKE